MDNIIAFPTKPVRDRATIERTICETLQNNGVSQEVINTILLSMDEFLQLLNFDFQLSIPSRPVPGIEHQLNLLSVALQERTKRLIIESLNMEVNHCTACGIS